MRFSSSFIGLLAMASCTSMVAQAAEMTGYIMDKKCIELCETVDPFASCTPDLSNSFYTPQDHTGWCLLLSVCVDSGYVIMSEEPVEDDGRHGILLELAGDVSQEAAVSYIRSGTSGAFPKVTVAFDDEDAVTVADANGMDLLQVYNATIRDPWDTENSTYFSGKPTTQTLCPDSMAPDIEMNNMCFRSDVMVRSGNMDTIIVESNGCPDHPNMQGSNGTVPVHPLNAALEMEESKEEGKPQGGCGGSCGGCGGCGGSCGGCACSDACSPCAGCSPGEDDKPDCGSCGGDEDKQDCGACQADCGTTDVSRGCGADVDEDSCQACDAETKELSRGGFYNGFYRRLDECQGEDSQGCDGGCAGEESCKGQDCGAGCGSCGGGCKGDDYEGCKGEDCGANCGGGCGSCGSCSSAACASESCGCGSGCGCGCGCGGGCGCGSGCGCGCGCQGCGDSSYGDDKPSHGTYTPLFNHYTMVIPKDPGMPGEATPVEDDVVGIMTNGVLLDSHKQTWAYDVCNGHSDKKHQYHYHIPPICFLESMGMEFADDHTWWISDDGNETRPFEELSEQFPPTGPASPVIGFARDGFPIFGPYDDSGVLQRSGAFGGDLDECNGKMDSNGKYGYYMSVDPPFAPSCLRGNVGSFTYATSDIQCPKEGIMNTIVAPGDMDDAAAVSRANGGSGRKLLRKTLK